MTKIITPDTEKALSLPVGAFSPLWLMFAGAAASGAAFYWARQWFKPVNLEALTPLPIPAPEPVEVAPVVEEAVETVEAVAEATVDTVEETVETVAEAAEEVVETLAEPVVEAVAAIADDLTKLTGIGPKLALSLAERGVTRFADIAAWTAEDVARFDKDMKLMGRIDREAWIAQARRYAEALN
jgi:predicted flap endonuclease-1-like 5' DNA nuclease